MMNSHISELRLNVRTAPNFAYRRLMVQCRIHDALSMCRFSLFPVVHLIGAARDNPDHRQLDPWRFPRRPFRVEAFQMKLLQEELLQHLVRALKRK